MTGPQQIKFQPEIVYIRPMYRTAQLDAVAAPGGAGDMRGAARRAVYTIAESNRIPEDLIEVKDVDGRVFNRARFDVTVEYMDRIAVGVSSSSILGNSLVVSGVIEETLKKTIGPYKYKFLGATKKENGVTEFIYKPMEPPKPAASDSEKMMRMLKTLLVFALGGISGAVAVLAGINIFG